MCKKLNRELTCQLLGGVDFSSQQIIFLFNFGGWFFQNSNQSVSCTFAYYNYNKIYIYIYICSDLHYLKLQRSLRSLRTISPSINYQLAQQVKHISPSSQLVQNYDQFTWNIGSTYSKLSLCLQFCFDYYLLE